MSVRIPWTHPKVHYLAVVNFNTDSIFFQMSAIDNVYIVKCCLIYTLMVAIRGFIVICRNLSDNARTHCRTNARLPDYTGFPSVGMQTRVCQLYLCIVCKRAHFPLQNTVKFNDKVTFFYENWLIKTIYRNHKVCSGKKKEENKRQRIKYCLCRFLLHEF